MALPGARRLIGGAAFALLTAGLVAGTALDPLFSRGVEAQAQPPVAESPAPPAPETESGVVDPASASTLVDPAPAATPAPPVGTEGTTANTAPPVTESGVTTSLGGSDVAVSSVGGSYEIDGPKRRIDRLPRPAPRP